MRLVSAPLCCWDWFEARYRLCLIFCFYFERPIRAFYKSSQWINGDYPLKLALLVGTVLPTVYLPSHYVSHHRPLGLSTKIPMYVFHIK
jgi:hypothetical protein